VHNKYSGVDYMIKYGIFFVLSRIKACKYNLVLHFKLAIMNCIRYNKLSCAVISIPIVSFISHLEQVKVHCRLKMSIYVHMGRKIHVPTQIFS
jgi:hypothetical protein